MNNTTCPSTNIGKSSQCEGCPSQSVCSTFKKDDLIDTIRNNMSTLKFVLTLMSGKGGVGKSTLTRNLAEYLSRKSLRVLILDLDLSGPSIPKMLGVEENSKCYSLDNDSYKNNNYNKNDSLFSLKPCHISDTLSCISTGYLHDRTCIYTSSTKTNIIRSILFTTNFSKYDILVIDTPPNITDEHLSIINYIRVDYTILVSTPQMISFQDVIRQISFCIKGNIKILGLIENMKTFKCTSCGHIQDIFSDCNIEEYCLINNIKYLGNIPLCTKYGMDADKGLILDNDLICEIGDTLISMIYI